MGRRIEKLKALNPFQDRSPVIRRHSAGYPVVTLMSFAISISGTRLFLELTGYPKLGGGTLHIAHVLWGGLFLFVASLLPIIFVNEWIFPISALISGFGIGLFIDEVGKFITSTNDYFYPSAAPIIYVFFLMVTFIFFQIRKSRQVSSRSRLYNILEQFKEVLDHDLSSDEYNDLTRDLEQVIQVEKSKALVDLATSLKGYLEENRYNVVPDDPPIFQRARSWLKRAEKKWLKEVRLRRIMFFGFLLLGIWNLLAPAGYFLVASEIQTPQILNEVIRSNMVGDAGGFNWFQVRVIMEGTMGVLALLAAIMIALKKERAGAWVGFVCLLVTLTVINPLVFYFDQFSTIVVAAFEFFLFILLLRYQRRFVPEPEPDIKPSQQ